MVTMKMLLHGFTVASDQGSFAFCGITLIRGAKNTIVDTAHLGRRELIRAKLAEQGLTPADIDYVFLTHAHWDHSQNIDMFPNAKVLITPAFMNTGSKDCLKASSAGSGYFCRSNDPTYT